MSNYIMLSDVERDRFALWCRQQAKSNEGIIVQLKKLGTPGEIIAKQQEREAIALIMVAGKLESTEQFTIGVRGE